MKSRIVFEQLKNLQGQWRGTAPTGREYTVAYDIFAANTVVMEQWQIAPGVSAATMYHLDGEQLIATHYCPAGNQPRLVLRCSDEPKQGIFHFDFISATNLPSIDEYHQHHFDLEILSPASFFRGETYLTGGKREYERVLFHRLGVARLLKH